MTHDHPQNIHKVVACISVVIAACGLLVFHTDTKIPSGEASGQRLNCFCGLFGEHVLLCLVIDNQCYARGSLYTHPNFVYTSSL